MLVGWTACNDSFDAHYSEDAGVTPEATLWNLIEQDANLTTFKALAEATGYDALLKSSQAFTVFAPTNEALLGLDLTTASQSHLNDIIRTHIARFKYIAGAELSPTVYTLNAKRIPFEYDGAKYTMKGSELEKINLLASNGILHTLKTPVPFVKNVWEYLTEQELDSIHKFFEAFHTRLFMPGSSKIIDYVGGYAVYDSAFVESNTMWQLYSNYSGNAVGYLNGVGYINNEDSLYTMILPTNTAWNAAYAQRFPYFETSAADADSLQHLNTQYSIIQDLVFRGKIDSSSLPDSLISTQSNVFSDPATLFSGTTPPYIASNGLVYTTDDLKHTHWESWQHPLTVEAERGVITLKEGTGDVTPNVLYAYLPAKPDIPSEACLLITNGLAGTKGMPTSIFFDVPNTLKATYNVYAVFAPMRYRDEAVSARRERTRILYAIQQLDRSTATKPADQQIWNTLETDDDGNTIGQATDSAAVKKILLKQNFTLPEANFNEKTTTIRIKLISAAVTRNADLTAGFNNRMLLDKIIFEPVH
ncbi:hypothetical protein FACS1894162_3180 [Bacteroidia bacterium]|nr:hypothetical protein FACS1894162_3180 [Bacteroidia bacterium]